MELSLRSLSYNINSVLEPPSQCFACLLNFGDFFFCSLGLHCVISHLHARIWIECVRKGVFPSSLSAKGLTLALETLHFLLVRVGLWL